LASVRTDFSLQLDGSVSQRGWVVVDMKKEWKVAFAFEKK
jgi:hypothetical protein